MPIDRLEGKFKLNQNRGRDDQFGVIEELEKRDDAESAALAAFARRHLDL
jgi:predicted FMN-binding regulatory protein PaiB